MIVQVKKDNNNTNETPTPTTATAASAAAADGKQDTFKKFENEGVVFKAKLIGSELVLEPRGDKMCQNSIQRLKAIIKGTNAHKRRVVLKISYDGVKVYDEKTNEILHHHEVSQISFIASDDSDNRTFGYVGDVPNKAHQFVCFKTSGPAINVITVINSLFEAVVEKKKQAEKEKQEEKEKKIISDDDIFGPTTETTAPPSSATTPTTPATNTIINNSSNNNNNNISKTNTTTTHTSNNTATLAANLITPPASLALASANTRATGGGGGLAFAPSFTPTSTASSSGKDHVDLIDDSGIMACPWPSTPIPVASSNNGNNGSSSSNININSNPGIPNRSLIYNHSSVSLSEAPLNRQSSFTSSSVKNDSYVDSVNKLSMNNINSSTGSILEPMNSSAGSQANFGMGPFGGGGGGGGVGGGHANMGMGGFNSNNINNNNINRSGMGGSMSSSMPKPNSSATIRQIPNFHMAAAHNNFSKSFNTTTYLQQTSSASSGFQSVDHDISSTSAGARSASTLEANMFRRTNPFDDDFFA